MLLAFVDGDFNKVVLWIAIASLFLGALAMLFTVFAVNRKKNREDNPSSSSADGDTPTDEGLDRDSPVADDGFIVMSRNVMYSASADGQIRAGKYVLNSADSTVDKFNVRFNGLVKEYKNGDTLVLADGDTISPVSGSVTLTPATED